jgi:hypothetical protein
MKARTGMYRYPLSPATAEASLVQRSIAPLAESPRSVYWAGVGLGIGCGGLVLAMLLGLLSL